MASLLTSAPTFAAELADCMRARDRFREQLAAGVGLRSPAGLLNAAHVEGFRSWLASLSDEALECVLLEAIEQSQGSPST